MKRKIVVLGLATGAATALIALHHGIPIGGPPRMGDQAPREAIPAEPPSSAAALEDDDHSNSPSPPEGHDLTVTEARSDTPVAPQGNPSTNSSPDRSGAIEWMRGEATRDVLKTYSVLLEQLGLSAQELDALVALLVEVQLSKTDIYAQGEIVQRGKPTTEEDRLSKVATIIGDRKLEEFLALERNLPAYSEVRRITSLLKQNGAPVTTAQRDKLLEILIETRGHYMRSRTTALTANESSSIEYLNQLLTEMNEYERHVVEQAPAALTPEQVVYLDEQYQYQQYRRADALESQRKQRADGTLPANSSWWYPPWND